MNEQGKYFPATAMPDRDWWQALWPDPGGVLRALGISPGMKVVDLCCGDGYFTAPLASLVDGAVYGVDLDQAMLARARREVERGGNRVEQWICADARRLADALPEEVDFVLLANTFHGIPEPTALARVVAAALKPGGYFAIVNWRALPREQTVVLGKPRGPRTVVRMAPEQVQAVVEPGGFTLQRIVDLPPYHYAALFRKVSPDNA